MKRKITELENVIIEKGYRLTSKTYKGKESQFTDSYIYDNIEQMNVLGSLFVELFLNKKRTKIEHIRFKLNTDILPIFPDTSTDELIELERKIKDEFSAFMVKKEK